MDITEKFILQLKYQGKFISEIHERYKSVILPLEVENQYLTLIKKILGEDIPLAAKGFYDIDSLNKHNLLNQQVKLKVYNLNRGLYNVAFNHLLNEFDTLFSIKYFNENNNNRTRLEVTQRMIEEKYFHDEIMFVADFYDRRNNNSISHASKKEYGYWSVSKDEYLEYEKKHTN